MFLLVEISVVVASLALVVIAVVMVHTMARVRRATDQVSKLGVEIHQVVGEAKELGCEARETLAEVRGIIAPIRRVVERFEPLGERTADLSTALLEEVAPMLRTAVATARGVRSATAYFLERLFHRFTHPVASRTEPRADP